MSMTLGDLAVKMKEGSKIVSKETKVAMGKTAQLATGHMKQAIQQVHAVDTGTMLNSVRSKKDGEGYVIGPTTDYAVFVAEGTSRMPARPFPKLALPNVQADFKRLVVSSLQKMG